MSNSSAKILKPQSMTGYAVLDHVSGNSKFRLHLKSVNNRFLDLKWRAPRAWVALEIPFKNQLKERFDRGSFEFWVEELKEASDKNENGAQHYLDKLNEALKSIKGVSRLSIPSFVQALILARNPELWFKNYEKAATPSDLAPIFEDLLGRFQQVRELEGQTLCDHLRSLGDRLRSNLNTVNLRLPVLRKEFEEEAQKRLQTLFTQFGTAESERSKIASEIALQIDRRDCSEEVQRIEMHLAAFDKALADHQSNLGKRLDFIAQELNREWNTLGSKVRVQDVFQIVLDSKLEIEKIREQCLNLA